MKKLKLKALELGAKEVLTRDQLRKVLGGADGSGSGSGSGNNLCSGAQCGGHWVGGATGHWEYGSCAYTPPIAGLPGGCFCSYGGQAC